MGKVMDILGQKFGMLTAIKNTGKKVAGYFQWEFRCDCGNTIVRRGSAVVGGKIKTCGCSRGKLVSESRTIHGEASNRKDGKVTSKEYRTWIKIKTRCCNPNDKDYEKYGGAGISIADEWANDFQKFKDHIGVSPSPLHSIDRIRNEEGYVPGNVRWADKKQQNNNRSSNLMVEINGETKTLAQWVDHFGTVSYSVAYRRLKSGKYKNDMIFGDFGENQ